MIWLIKNVLFLTVISFSQFNQESKSIYLFSYSQFVFISIFIDKIKFEVWSPSLNPCFRFLRWYSLIFWVFILWSWYVIYQYVILHWYFYSYIKLFSFFLMIRHIGNLCQVDGIISVLYATWTIVIRWQKTFSPAAAKIFMGSLIASTAIIFSMLVNFFSIFYLLCHISIVIHRHHPRDIPHF